MKVEMKHYPSSITQYLSQYFKTGIKHNFFLSTKQKMPETLS